MAATEPLLILPSGPGPHPGVVLAAEAFGVNDFMREVAERLAAAGYAALLPDYYRGVGPKNGESYDDFTEVMEHIGRLDFTRAARDIADGVDLLRANPSIDPARVATWGYCTGGTLAWLAACQRGDIAATVLFFPSQPWFAELGPSTPVHPVDLLWMLECPSLFIYGDQDAVMPAEQLADLRARIAQWSVPAEVRIYPGGGHAFSAPWGPLRHEPSDVASWADAMEFLGTHLAARSV
jgi:carboxymethylenebutenolidase